MANEREAKIVFLFDTTQAEVGVKRINTLLKEVSTSTLNFSKESTKALKQLQEGTIKDITKGYTKLRQESKKVYNQQLKDAEKGLGSIEKVHQSNADRIKKINNIGHKESDMTKAA